MTKYRTTKEIDVAELRIGMFVTRLETAWSATEFPLQGTLIRNRQDILKISQYGRKVTIDQERCSESSMMAFRLPYVQKTRSPQKIKIHKEVQRPWRKFCTNNYETSKVISKEIIQAKRLLARVEDVFTELKQDLTNINDDKVAEIKSVSNEIVSSLLVNPDALLWLTKVKADNGRVYEHTVRTSIWATLMGRSMGLRRSSLNALNQAILLSGIGKAELNINVWRKYDSAKMQPEYAMWSSITIGKLAKCKTIDPQVLTIIANMTERYDGSGYPTQKSAKKIPYLSQIAGLVESFDLILQPMLYGKKITFGKALSKLYCLADTLFDGALVEEFIQATGLYPAGTQVLLSNGYYGVVVEQSKSRRIRATVALTHNAEGYRLLKYTVVQLGEAKYENVIIQQESEKYKLNEDDLKQINVLIQKHQASTLSRIFASFNSNG